VRVDAPVTRRMGAGPATTATCWWTAANAALPVEPALPLSGEWPGRLVRDGTGPAVDHPVYSGRKFYRLVTADGVRMRRSPLARGERAGHTVVQTCIRYAEDQRCRFCTIEESLREGATIGGEDPRRSWPRVAEAAVRPGRRHPDGDDDWHHHRADRGARNLVRSVSAVRSRRAGLAGAGADRATGRPDGAQRSAPGGAHRPSVSRRVADDEVRRAGCPARDRCRWLSTKPAWE